MSSFDQFGLDPRILSAIERMGYTQPTPIQEKAIPVVLMGGDVMGAAQTGTGKTAGYGLPLIARILPKANTSMSPARHPVRALILAPTRELADQVSDNLVKYCADTPLRAGVVYGGVDIRPQADMLRRGVEILTATPGRLLDHVQQRSVNLSQVEIVVLDEATAFADPENEVLIQKAFATLTKGRTVIMIAHRLSTVVGADKIIILEEGHIVEQGTHAELTASGGLYARMWTDYNKAVQWKITSEKEAE